MNKNFLAKQNNDINEFEKKSKRESNAWYLLESIKRSKSDWVKTEFVKSLSLYLDLEFVKQELMMIYKKTSSNELRKTIKNLHDGTLDLTQFYKELEENTKLFEESQIHKEETRDFINDYYQNESPYKLKGKLDSSAISLLRIKSRDSQSN
jgi:hypothetical protein